MAESKFLSLQDGFGQENLPDGLNDQCGDLEVIPAATKCPGCIPNTNYVAPNWKGLDQTQPWFDERECTYYITVETTEVKTIPYSGSSTVEDEEFMSTMYDTYRSSASENILIGMNKLSGPHSIEILNSKLKNEKFYLDPNPSSYLKLLYSVDYDTMELLGISNVEADSESQDEQEEIDSQESEGEDASTPGAHSVTLNAEDLNTGINQLVQGLKLYNRRYKMLQALDSMTLIYDTQKIVFPLKQVSLNVAKIRDGLVSFVAKKGFKIGSEITINARNSIRAEKEVTQIIISFRGDYRLNALEVYYKGCEGEPITYKGKRIRRLKKLRAFKSTSAMGYIAAYHEMMSDLKARQPIPYIDFLIAHTFPVIKLAKGYPKADPSIIIDGFEVPIRCSALSNFLERQGIQLGQDLMDQDFSLRDSLEHAFARTTNRGGISRWQQQQAELGTIYAPTQINRDYIKGLALTQASQTIQVDDNVYSICRREFDMGFVDDLRDFLDRIKSEGLKEMVLEAMKSMMQGISLRQALPIILGAALAGMSVIAYGRLYKRMKADKRSEIDSIVRRKIAQFNRGPKAPPPGVIPVGTGMASANLNVNPQSVVATGGSIVDLPAVDSLVGDTSRRLEFFRPWVLLKDLGMETSEIAKGSAKMPNISGGLSLNQSQKKTRTLAKKLTTSAGQNQAEDKVYDCAALMVFFVEATIDAYAGDYAQQAAQAQDYADSSIYDLLDLLEGFPGTRLIAEFLKAADFPDTPLMQGGFLEWMNDRTSQPLFRGSTNLRIPYIRNPLFIRAKMMDFTHFLFEAARLAVQRAIMLAMSKMIQLACKAIDEGPKAAIDSLKGAKACGESFQNSFSKLIDDGILRYAGYTNRQRTREHSADDTLRCTTIEMFQKFGAGAAALSNPDTVMNFIDDLSCSLTRKEMMSTFLGETSSDTNKLIESLVDNQYPNLSDMFDNVGSPGELFKAMGDTFPPEFRDKLQDFVDRLDDVDEMPANPSLCASEEDLRDFCELRARLLDGRSSTEQSNLMCEESNEGLLQSLKDLASSLDDPLANAVPEQMVSDPGCDNGLLPFQPEETITAAAITLNSRQEGLSIAFAEDMMSANRSSPGFINMIMSDTMGNPLTTHYGLVENRRDYVNFYVSSDSEDQYGQFPASIASWLQTQLKDISSTAIFNTNNLLGEDRVITKTYSSIGIGPFGGVQKVDLPDFGYNTTIDVSAENETISFTRKARKSEPDIKLSFEDNNNGLSSFLGTNPAFAFNMSAYFSEFNSSGLNIYSDNLRINITYLNYQASLGVPSNVQSMGIAGAATWLAEQGAGAISAPQKSREYEFLSTESTLDDIDLSKYPLFAQSFEDKEEYSPPFVLLSELIQIAGVPLDSNNLILLKEIYDEAQQSIYNTISNTIADNTAAFTYGATYDPLDKEMVAYVVGADQTDSDGGTSYYDATIDGESLIEEDMILGMSHDQYLNGDNARVLYLDPNQYGGSYTRPPLYIKPLSVQGWMGLLDVIFPPEVGCGAPSDIISFQDIVEETSEAYRQIPEDDRLAIEECSVELPYNKMMTRLATIQAEGAIRSTCRIFAAVNLIKSLATITKFAPDFDKLYSPVYAQFVVENIKHIFSAPLKKSRVFKGTLKDNDFWYRFLELSVQTYGRMVDEGRIIDPPKHVLDALSNLNDLQEAYKVPTRKKFRHLRRGGDPLAKSVLTLSAFQEAKKMEFIKWTEEPAKIILAEFVKQNLNKVGASITNNLSSIDLEPDFEDAGYYFMTELCHSYLDDKLNRPLQQETKSLPVDPGSGYYTSGDELVVELDEEGLASTVTETYVGYYHIHMSAEGIQYMTGEYHTDEAHAILKPVAGEIIIPIGDLIDFEGINNSSVTPDASKPFVLEKYISIEGIKYSVEEGTEIIKSNSGALNISEVYPGTLSVVHRKDLLRNLGSVGQDATIASADTLLEDWWQEPIGLSGALGVRYGIQLSMLNDGVWTRTLATGATTEQYSSDMLKVEVLSVEMDVLDKKINEFVPYAENSPELLCMLKKLQADEKFKLLVDYIFPIKKHISLLAIYNNLAFLPSIGQTTINPFNDVVSDSIPLPGGESVPGVTVSVDSLYNVTYSNSDAWSSSLFRVLNSTLLGVNYDEWDQAAYTRVMDQVKQTLDEAYYSVDDDFNTLMVRNFSPGRSKGARSGAKLDKASLSEEARKRLKEKLKPSADASAGGDVLTRQQIRSVINNPFDAQGSLCKKG